MRRLIFYFVTLIIILNSFPAIAAIKGIVSNLDGEPLQAVTVQIPELKKQVSTSKHGEFEIAQVPQGTYKFKFFRVGVRPLDTTITISSGSEVLNIKMKDVYEIKKGIVVTGTRTAKQIESNPIATEVVTGDEIKKAGGLRLDNVLSEETGLFMVEDHGKGIQIQGLDPDYALILINGEPIIGRNGGVLDLKRLAMGNVKRVEVVKGPSSCMYGSNALSGVINIITEEPTQPFEFGLSARGESFNTYDLNANAGAVFLNSDLGMNFYFDRLSSDGFTLRQADDNLTGMESYGKTVPEYTNYTFSSELFYNFSPTLSAKFGARMNSEDQKNIFDITEKDTLKIIDDNSSLKDYNLSLLVKHQITEKFNYELKGYYTAYKTITDYTYQDNGALYEKYDFDQDLKKCELIINHMLYTSHILTFGGGLNFEHVKSLRIGANGIDADSKYALFQWDWLLNKEIDIIASARYDTHSDYADHFTPKFAASFRVWDGLILKASVGTGFKAPTFQQLYLDWTNSIAGYSVFGSAYFKEGYNKLKEAGVIADEIIPVDRIKELTPEKSFSVNGGFVWDLGDRNELKINMFWNKLSDMIDVLPVATKQSGAQVFGYFNFKEVYTQGAEINFTSNFAKNFRFSAGFQYLDTYDKEAINEFSAGHVFDNTGMIKENKYGGLWNRSKYSGNFKIDYNNTEYGLNVFIRSVVRGRYGFEDKNKTTYLDAENEYAPGYAIFNFAATKDFLRDFSVQFGVDNILDKMDVRYLTTNPGRTFFVNLSYKFYND